MHTGAPSMHTSGSPGTASAHTACNVCAPVPRDPHTPRDPLSLRVGPRDSDPGHEATAVPRDNLVLAGSGPRHREALPVLLPGRAGSQLELETHLEVEVE
eukprot:3333037-Rhodomonas_salina.1